LKEKGRYKNKKNPEKANNTKYSNTRERHTYEKHSKAQSTIIWGD